MVMFKEGQRNPNFGILLENLIIAEKWGEIWRGSHDEFGKVLIVAYKRDPGRAMFDRALPHLKKWSRLAEGGQRGLLRLHKIYSSGKVPILIVDDPGLKTAREHFSATKKNLKSAARFAHACSKALVKAEEAGLPSIGYTPDTVLYNPERRETPCSFIPVCPGALGMEVQLGDGRYLPPGFDSDSKPFGMGLDVYALGWIWTEILRGAKKIELDPFSMDQYVKREDLRKVIRKLQEHGEGNYCRASEAEALIANWWKKAKDERSSQATAPPIAATAIEPVPAPSDAGEGSFDPLAPPPMPPPVPSRKKKSPPPIPQRKASAKKPSKKAPKKAVDDDDDFFRSKPKRKFPIVPIAAGVLGLLGLAIGAMVLMDSFGGSGGGGFDVANEFDDIAIAPDATPNDMEDITPEEASTATGVDEELAAASDPIEQEEDGGEVQRDAAPTKEPTRKPTSAQSTPTPIKSGPKSMEEFIAEYRTVNESRDWGALLDLFHFDGTPEEVQPKLAARGSAFRSKSFDTEFEARDNFAPLKTETFNGVEYEPNLHVVGNLKVTSGASKRVLPVGIVDGVYKIAGLTKMGDGPRVESLIEEEEEEGRNRSKGRLDLASGEPSAEFELGTDLLVKSSLAREEFVGSWVVNPRAEFSNSSEEALYFHYHLAIFDSDRNLIGCDSVGAQVDGNATGPIAGIMIEAPGEPLREATSYEAVLYEDAAPIATSDFDSTVASSSVGADESAAMVVSLGDKIRAEAKVYAESREGETVILVPAEIHNGSDRSALVTYHIALFDNYGALLGGASDNAMVDPGQYFTMGQPEIRVPGEALSRIRSYQIVLYDEDQEIGRTGGTVEKGTREIAAPVEPVIEETPEEESEPEPEFVSDDGRSEEEIFLDDLFSDEPDAPYIPPGKEVAALAEPEPTAPLGAMPPDPNATSPLGGTLPGEELAPTEVASFNSGETAVDEDDPLAVRLGWGKHAGVNEMPYSQTSILASPIASALGYLGGGSGGGSSFGTGAGANPFNRPANLLDDNYYVEEEMGIVGWIFTIVLTILLGYVYPAICYSRILEKTDIEESFIAWFPILNFVAIPIIITGRPTSWYFFVVLPVIGLFFLFVIYWDMCIRLEKSGFWAFGMVLVPPIALGYLAFSD